MYRNFIPLSPGEAPGDPELGGWRPLPSSYYRHLSALYVISLCQALQYLGFELRYRKLTRAMEIIANKLRQQ